MMARVQVVLRDFACALRDPAFWSIFLAMGLGLFALWSPLSLLLLAVLLTLWSCVSNTYWFDQFRERGLLPALAWFWLGCLAQNMLFIGAAFAAGLLTRWLWVP